MPAQLDLTGSRNATWAPTIEYAYTGGALPLTGATMRLQWRLYPGASGAALIDLAAVEFTDTAEPTTTEPDLRVLRLFPEVPVATLQALPTGLNEPEAGEADAYAWDVVITYADAVLERLIAGDVFLDPGVTRNG